MQELFSRRLKQLRKERRITQEYLANSVGVDISTVKRWERGEFGPDFDKLEKIAMALDIPVSWLFIPETPESSQNNEESQELFDGNQRRHEKKDLLEE